MRMVSESPLHVVAPIVVTPEGNIVDATNAAAPASSSGFLLICVQIVIGVYLARNAAAAETRQEHAAAAALGLLPRVPCLAAALVLDLMTAHRTLLNWSVGVVDRVHGLCDGAAGVVVGHLLGRRIGARCGL
jgi:hypothetical protein